MVYGILDYYYYCIEKHVAVYVCGLVCTQFTLQFVDFGTY